MGFGRGRGMCRCWDLGALRFDVAVRVEWLID